MKVCHITNTMDGFGGAERVLVNLLMANPELTHKRMVLVLSRGGAWIEQLQTAGVMVHVLGLESIWDLPRVFYQLKKLIKSFQPDIVQTWMYHANFVGGLAARFAGYKNIVWSIHRTSLSLSDSKITLLTMKLCALLSHWIPKKIIQVAEAGRQAHVKAGYNAERMVVIPNGFDFSTLTATSDQRNNLRNAYNISEDELVIGCLGRFHHAKGQDNFVKAARLVVNSNPKVKFMMVGERCDHNNSILNNWINKNNLQESFVLLGERDDVPVCLASMDIFCMPSRTEGFPVALGEAMAMGLPCVATEVGDTAVLVGNTAILVPALDVQALSRGLLSVISFSIHQRNQMGQRAKERVKAKFPIGKTCEHYDAVYREIISEATT